MSLPKRGTADNFGKFLVSNTGKVRYLIGTRGEKSTPELIKSRWDIFISYRTNIDRYAERTLRNGPLPDGSWVVADCNGFFEMFLNGGWFDKPLTRFKYSDVSTYHVHNLAIQSGLAHGDMSTLPRDCPYPIAVGYPGHVGYFHNGVVYQAAGHAVGTIIGALSDTRYNSAWRFWYQIPWLDYGEYKFKEVKRMLRLQDPFMRGDDVKSFQEAANKIINAGLTVDGIFGPASDRAARNLQEHFKITVDGIVGPATWAKIEEALLPGDCSAELAALEAKVTALENDKKKLSDSVGSLTGQLTVAKNDLTVKNADLKTIARGIDTALKYR